MTKENEEKNLDEEQDVTKSDKDNDSNVESESSTKQKKSNNYSDGQVLGGIILGLIVLMGGVILLGGGAGTAVDFNYPEWADDDGIVMNEQTGQPDIQPALQSHTEVLSSDSFTLNVNFENDLGEQGTEESSLEYKYNAESQTAYGVQDMNGERMETYDEILEERQLVAQGVENMTYDRQPLLQNLPFAAAAEFEIMAVLNVEAVDTNENVVIYEVDGVNEELAGDVDIDATGEIHLHEDGYFTNMDVDIQDNQQGFTTSQEVSISEIGSTDVEEPEWYSEAIEQTEELTDEDFEEAQQPPEEEIPEEIPEEEIPEEIPEGEDGDEPIVIE